MIPARRSQHRGPGTQGLWCSFSSRRPGGCSMENNAEGQEVSKTTVLIREPQRQSKSFG